MLEIPSLFVVDRIPKREYVRESTSIRGCESSYLIEKLNHMLDSKERDLFSRHSTPRLPQLNLILRETLSRRESYTHLDVAI